MAKISTQRAIITALEVRGFVESGTIGRHVVLGKSGVNYNFFVGSSGGLRKGPNKSTSFSLDGPMRDKILAEGLALIEAGQITNSSGTKARRRRRL